MNLDPRIQAAIIAFVSAMIATAISNWVSFKLAEKKAEADKRLSHHDNLRRKREETIKNLHLLHTMLSPDKMDMAKGSQAVEYFNSNYDKANELIAEVKMSLSLYFTKHKNSFEPILSESANYWKYYKDHLVAEENQYGENSKFERAGHAAIRCQNIIKGIEKELVQNNA